MSSRQNFSSDVHSWNLVIAGVCVRDLASELLDFTDRGDISTSKLASKEGLSARALFATKVTHHPEGCQPSTSDTEATAFLQLVGIPLQTY